MLEIIFTGEFDQADSNLIRYTGEAEGYGTITLLFNRLTGAWTATVPSGFPSGIDITAVWQDLDAEVIRQEPDSINQVSLDTPESELSGNVIMVGGTLTGTIGGTLGYVGGTTYGTIEGEFLDDVPWRRHPVAEGERRLAEGLILAGASKAVAIARHPTVLDHTNVPWLLKPTRPQTLTRPLPLDFEVGTEYYDTCFAQTHNGPYMGLAYAGLVYGVLVADPQSFFSPIFRDGLWEWWPLNEHPESALAIEEKRWGSKVKLPRPFMAHDRTLEPGWGWQLHIPRINDGLELPFHQEFPEGPMSLSFRFTPLVEVVENSDGTLFKLGPIELRLSTTSGPKLALEINGTLADEWAMTLGNEYLFYMTYNGSNRVIYELVAITGLVTVGGTIAGTLPVGGSETLQIGGDVAMTALIADIKLWDVEKSWAELEAYITRTFKPAPQARWPSTVTTPSGDILALLTWPKSGFIYPGTTPLDAELPTYMIERESTTLIQDEVIVSQDPRREDFGLDGGQVPPLPWRLGTQFHPVMGDGHVVVATTVGVIGSNPIWEDEFTLSQEPNRNVGLHRIFGSMPGQSWQLAIRGTILGTTSFPVLDITEVDYAGLCMPLVDGGGYTCKIVDGALVRTGPSGLFPTMYLYGPSTAKVSMSGLDNWVDPNTFGIELGFPAIEHRGKITFYVDVPLEPGPYQLNLDAGNYGQVDASFEGLDVEISIAQSITFPARIKGEGLSNPRAIITKAFEVQEAIPSGWLLEVSWQGRLGLPQKNITYALAIYGVVVEKMIPTLYRVDDPTTLTPLLSATHIPSTSLPGTIPGGWIGLIGNDGMIVDWVHESEEQTRNLPGGHHATILSECPSGLNNRMEDILLASPSWTTPDPAAPSLPTIGSFSTPHTANMGATITYTASGVANATALVWKFWDGEVRVTAPTVTSQQKKLTIGGTVTSTLTAVNEVGQSTTATDTFTANAAPTLLHLGISKNDAAAPYDTVVTIITTDQDSDSGTYPSANIYGTIAGTVDSTSALDGGGKVYGTLSIPLTIATDIDHTLELKDDSGAIRTLPLAFRTSEARPMIVTVSVAPRRVRVGANSTLRLSAMALPADADPVISFSWSMLEANGWAANSVYSGQMQALVGGAWQNTLVLDVSGESEGDATIIVTATTASGKIGTGVASVYFDVNEPPTFRYFSLVPGMVTPGQPHQLGVDAIDVENDSFSCYWKIDDPTGVVAGTLRAGNPIVVYPVAGTIPGTLTMTDVLGASTVVVIPKMMFTGPMVVEGTVGTPFTYVLTAMGVPYPTFSVDSVPPGMVYVDGTVSGVPSQTGLGTISLKATNADGVDERHVIVSVVKGSAPLAPTGLLVKGMNYPTYRHGEDISMTWKGSGSYTILRFYKVDNTMVLQVVLDPGVESYAIDNGGLVRALGTEQSFVVHAFSSDGVTESNTFVEAGVQFLG